jgi:hypothetical protein
MKAKLRSLPSASTSAAILVRVAFATALLLALVIFCAKPIAIALLPLYRMVFELITGDFRILYLGLSYEGADSVIRMDVTLSRTIAVAGHLVVANPQGIANVTTMVGNLFQPVMVGLIAILAWPFGSWRIVLLRLIILLLLALIETILDIPLLLAGELWGLFFDNLPPGSWSALTVWADFLQGGGRFVMGLAAATGSIAASEYATKLWGDSK